MQVWSQVDKVMKEEGYNISANDLRRKYSSLLATYKQLKDYHEGSGKYINHVLIITHYPCCWLYWNLSLLSGKNRINFKFERAFEEAFGEMSTMEIDAVVDDSAE